MTNKKYLILTASFLRCVAGASVFFTGFFQDFDFNVVFFIKSASIFFIFYFLIFSKMSEKNAKRILNLPEEKNPVRNFFDKKTYLIMAFMMSFGVAFRKFAPVSKEFIGFFYTGLGFALFTAGFKAAFRVFKKVH